MAKFLKTNCWLITLLCLFVFIRLFGLGQLYHQDEYRWASIANPFFSELSVHPPINRISLQLAGRVFGYDNLRIVPFFFSLLNLLLIYFISLRLGGSKKTARIAAGLFTINIYSVISNLQIDIDGALLPFFVLISYYLYLNIISGNKKLIPFFALAIAGGFLTKINFVLFLGALASDYFFKKNGLKINKKIVLAIFAAAIFLSVFYSLYVSRLPRVIDYAKHFKAFNFQSRAYFDLIFKLFKSLVWLSPLLTLPLVWGLFKKEILTRYKFWFVYMFLNLLFYLVIFDFTNLTIERYFMFLIVPAVLISAEIINRLTIKLDKRFVMVGLAGFILLFLAILFFNQQVVPLNPKAEYLYKVKSLDFNFLIPLTGGSGPIGFYASAQFVLWTWTVSVIAFLLGLLKKSKFFHIFLIFAVGYNVILMNEYLSGWSYGNVDRITKTALAQVIDNKNISGVITYYDLGAYYLKLHNKYSSRFYTAPNRDYTKKLIEYRGHYMIVDFPAIDKKSNYWKLLSRCDIFNKFSDKKVDAYIFDCSNFK